MAYIRDIRELQEYIGKLNDDVEKAKALALIATVADAEAFAKRNATKQFIGRRGRKLTGRLLNSIYSGVEVKDNKLEGFVGTRGIPYGRIHELGGEIYPVKAKHLWVKMYGGKADNFRRMTPSEFIQAKEANPKQFVIVKTNNALIAAWNEGKVKSRLVPLFVLRNKVTIPARPYLAPAVEESMKRYPMHFNRIIKQLHGRS